MVRETTPRPELLSLDSAEPDTTLVAGTRKLIAVMFWLLKVELPPQEQIDGHIIEVAKDYE